jgi:hypothetical protein
MARPNVFMKVSAAMEMAAAAGSGVGSGVAVPRDLGFYRPVLELLWAAFGAELDESRTAVSLTLFSLDSFISTVIVQNRLSAQKVRLWLSRIVPMGSVRMQNPYRHSKRQCRVSVRPLASRRSG